MRPFWKKVAAAGFLALLVLWVAGVVRGWTLPYSQAPAGLPLLSEAPSQRLQVANNLAQIGLARTPLPLVLDRADVEQIRVYEKAAQLTTGSAEFDEDETRLREALAAHQAVVFNEKHSGLAPERRLTLEIGVAPDRFDALVQRLREVAHLDSVSVQKRDRTVEFRRLHAQRQSLKNYLQAVLKLRDAGKFSLEERLKVEQRIQDIEKELQALSVQFGELLGKESFYHVYVTLYEYQPGSRLDRTFTWTRRLTGAFLWALGWWCVLAVAVGVLAGTYVSVRTLWPRRAKAAATGAA